MAFNFSLWVTDNGGMGKVHMCEVLIVSGFISIMNITLFYMLHLQIVLYPCLDSDVELLEDVGILSGRPIANYEFPLSNVRLSSADDERIFCFFKDSRAFI